MKRICDFCLAAIGIVMCAPLFGVLALAIKFTDRGPVFFSQERVGQYGKVFRVHKFRTMVTNADRLGPLITAGGDPRITPIGHWLRKSKLDELPQLWNVLVGEMSFVGPRPEVQYYVDQYDETQRDVLTIKPGITDPASLAFVEESEILARVENPSKYYVDVIMPEKIRRNMAYAGKANLLRDIGMILQTVWRIAIRTKVDASPTMERVC